MKTSHKTYLAVVLAIAATIVWIIQLPPIPGEWPFSMLSERKSPFAIDLVDMTLPSTSYAIEQFCELYGTPPTGSSAEIQEQLLGKNPQTRHFLGGSPLMEVKDGRLYYQGTPFHIEVMGDSNLVRMVLRWSGPNGQLGDGDDRQNFSVIRPKRSDRPQGPNSWFLIYSSGHTPPPENLDHLKFLVPRS